MTGVDREREEQTEDVRVELDERHEPRERLLEVAAQVEQHGWAGA